MAKDPWLQSVHERLDDAGRDPESGNLWRTVFNKAVSNQCNTSSMCRHDALIYVWNDGGFKAKMEEIISSREKKPEGADYNPYSKKIQDGSPLLKKVSTPAEEEAIIRAFHDWWNAERKKKISDERG